MQDDPTEIHGDPAVGCGADDSSFHAVRNRHGVIGHPNQAADHAVAGAGTNNEIIGKNGHPLQVDQDDIFCFFLFKRAD